MNDIIEQLRKSKSVLLQTEGEDVLRWSKLRHTKDNLELMLQFNLVQLSFKNVAGVESQIICTSNTKFIKIFSLKKKEDKRKLINFSSPGLTTKDKNSVLTWDLQENKYKTIILKDWYVVNFISITPENALVLDEVVHKLLKV